MEQTRRRTVRVRPVALRSRQRGWLIIGLLGALVASALLLGRAGAAPEQAGTPRYYAATGQTLAGQFTAYFDAHGGLPVFGYPIGPAQQEGGYLVQYTERERLEYHPENAGTPYEVLLGRLGADLTSGRADGPFAPVPASAFLPAHTVYVSQTQHWLGGDFLDYWQAHGGLAMFGYPISQEFTENGLREQWFERARFEFHPELPAAFRVSLGLLGREDLTEQSGPRATIAVSAGPSRPLHLQLGLSEGGESYDPDFLHNVVPLIGALHIPLIRIDNIYTHYNVVGRDSHGRLTYNWTGLDQVVNDVLAMGAQPLMCLSYTPPAMSPDGTRIQPPASMDEWRQLVQATVAHYNRDLKLGLRYWEVWNEPDQWSFWRGSWPDYLSLYDVTRRAVRAVDPQAHVGGPARSSFDAGALDWFLNHQEQPGASGGVEFLSWHAYGLSPQTVADQVGTVRNLLAAHPRFHPELAITEFNVLTGGAGDTSVDHQTDTSAGAAYVLGMLDTMDQAGLDWAFLFEAKDGYNPAADYWGRWGITTAAGRTKPVYHALQAYQDLGAERLPVQTNSAAGLGALAATPGGVPHVIVWNSGTDSVRTQVTLPPEWQARSFTATLFDSAHNNAQATGDDTVKPYGTRLGDDLVFDLQPGSFLVLIAQ